MPGRSSTSAFHSCRRAALAVAGVCLLAAVNSCTTLNDVTLPSCTYGVAPASASFGTSGGTGTFAVTAAGVCSWTVGNQPSWISITSGTSGKGNGAVNYSVGANSELSSRTANLAVAGQTVTVTQAGMACSFGINPTSASFGNGGGDGSIAVTAPGGCAWSVSGGAAWISITSGGSGNGDGTVRYAVQSNSATSARSANLTIGGQTFTVNQSGGGGSPCSYSVTPDSESFDAGAGSGSIAVATAAGCGWSASSGANWITITAGATGSGNGTVQYSVSANPGGARSSSVTVAGETVSISQAGSSSGSCSYAVNPATITPPSAGGTGNINVTAASGCTWSASSNVTWITITNGTTGNGNGTVQYSVVSNPGPGPRTGTITVAGQPVVVTQNGLNCGYTVTPMSASFPAGGGTNAISVAAAAGCTWTAISNATWLIVNNGSTGNGNGTVQYGVAGNSGSGSRTGTITVAGHEVTITQSGFSCSVALNPTSASFSATGGNDSVAVGAPAGCTWAPSASAGWITITNNGTGNGNGTVLYSVAANTSITGRTGTITIAGQTLTITQAGVPCTYTVNPTSVSWNQNARNASITVSLPNGCPATPWAAVSNASWITITSGATGSGNGTVNYSITANTGTSPRVGTMTIAGQTVTITQSNN